MNRPRLCLSTTLLVTVSSSSLLRSSSSSSKLRHSNPSNEDNHPHCSHLQSLLETSVHSHGCLSIQPVPTPTSSHGYPGLSSTSDPCNMFEPGSRTHEQTLQEMGLNALKQMYEKTESNLCEELIERMLPTLLNDDTFTTSSSFPVGAFTASKLSDCHKLKTKKEEMDEMWRTALRESTFVQSDVDAVTSAAAEQTETTETSGEVETRQLGNSATEGVSGAAEESASGTAEEGASGAAAEEPVAEDSSGSGSAGDATAVEESATEGASGAAGEDEDADKGTSNTNVQQADIEETSTEETNTNTPNQTRFQTTSSKSTSIDKSNELEKDEMEAEQKENVEEARREKVAAEQRIAYAKTLRKQVEDLEKQVEQENVAFLQVHERSLTPDWWSNDEIECEKRVDNLQKIDFNESAAEYDQLNTQCTVARAELKTYIRNELSKPNKEIQPVELQTFLNTQNLPIDIDKGICHLFKSTSIAGAVVQGGTSNCPKCPKCNC